MDGNDLSKIEGKIGYVFRNKDLLQQAFVRRSYSQENGGGDNEVLEFIGDKVLDFIIVKMLTEAYGDVVENEEWNEYICDCREGEMSELKRQLVEGKTLAERIDMLEFADYLILGKGDIKNKVFKKQSVKEDLFEAILGSVALDSNWNIDELYEVVDIMLDPFSYISDDIEDQYISLIQNWVSKKCNTNPLYTCRKNNYLGRYERFCCELRIDGFYNPFVGFGDSKCESRVNAAEKAYDYLSKNNMLFSIKDEIENPNEQQAINQLETLARRGYFELPKYKFTETHDKNGNPKWQVTCIIDDIEKVFNATSTSKKAAKKKAAYKMLNFVLENYDEEE